MVLLRGKKKVERVVFGVAALRVEVGEGSLPILVKIWLIVLLDPLPESP